MTDEDIDYDFGDRSTVPKGEGMSIEEASRKHGRATVDLSCPEGCFELEVRGRHETRDSREFLEEIAITDDPGPCPHCGAKRGETDG